MKRAAVFLCALAAGCGSSVELTLDIHLPVEEAADARLFSGVTTLGLSATRDGVELAHQSFSATAGTVSLTGVSHGARTIFTLEGTDAQGSVVARGQTCAVDFEGATTADLYFAPTSFFGATANDPVVARTAPAAMALDDGTALIAGGSDGTAAVASTDVFTPGVTTFASGPLMNQARASAEGTALPSIGLLMTGGLGPAGDVLASGEIYLESDGMFLKTAPVIEPRVEHRASLLPDGRVLLTGGRAAAGGPALATTQFVTVKSDGTFQVSTPATTPTPTLAEARRAHAAVVTIGVPFLFGGYGAGDVLLESIEALDPATAAAGTIVAHMTTARAEATASLLTDGSILVVGGVGAAGPLAQSEVFIPVLPSKKVTPAPTLAVARYGHTATVLADGRVLVTGGTGADGQPLKSVEIYDPSVGDFLTGRDLTTARTGHVAVPLCDGTVLVVGGGAGAELYNPSPL